MLTLHPVLPLRAALVAGAAAALALLAMANLSVSAPPIARTDKALSVHAPIAGSVLMASATPKTSRKRQYQFLFGDLFICR